MKIETKKSARVSLSSLINGLINMEHSFQICELQARLEGLQHVHATDARKYAARLAEFEQV